MEEGKEGGMMEGTQEGMKEGMKEGRKGLKNEEVKGKNEGKRR